MKQLVTLLFLAATEAFPGVDRLLEVPQHKKDIPLADQHTALLLLKARQCQQPENPDSGLLSACMNKNLTRFVLQLAAEILDETTTGCSLILITRVP